MSTIAETGGWCAPSSVVLDPVLMYAITPEFWPPTLTPADREWLACMTWLGGIAPWEIGIWDMPELPAVSVRHGGIRFPTDLSH